MISTINKAFDRLAEAVDRDDKAKILKKLVLKTSAVEQKWIVRILTKKMSIGLNTKSVLDCLHPMAAERYAVSSNLRQICEEAKNPHSKFDAISVQLFSPLKPMLAARRSLLSFHFNLISSTSSYFLIFFFLSLSIPPPEFSISFSWRGNAAAQ